VVCGVRCVAVWWQVVAVGGVGCGERGVVQPAERQRTRVVQVVVCVRGGSL